MTNFEITPEMDALISAVWKIAKENQPPVKIVNPDRYRDVMEAKKLLQKLLIDNFDDSVVEMKVHYMFSRASLSIEVPYFAVNDAKLFKRIIDIASNFEICPKLNGNVEISFTFSKYLISA